MGVFGSFGDWVGGALDYLGENNALGSAIIAGTTLISGLMQPDKAPMSEYQEGQLALERETLSANQALERERLAQQLAIAQMNAAASGAGAGATVTAARIRDATERQALKDARNKTLLEGNMKLADSMKPEVIGELGMKQASLAQGTGQLGVDAFDRLVARMQAPLLRGR